MLERHTLLTGSDTSEQVRETLLVCDFSDPTGSDSIRPNSILLRKC